MPDFSYRAVNKAGQVVEGVMAGPSPGDVHRILEADGLLPVSIEKESGARAAGGKGSASGRIRTRDTARFARQLSTLLKAGLPVLQSLRILAQQSETRAWKNIIENLAESIEKGASLSEAFSRHPRVFSKQFVQVVISGESGGDMVRSLLCLADWMEREQEFRAEVKSALRYPVMVITALIAASAILAVFVVPRFAVFFSRASIPLPLPTRILVSGNNFVQANWVWMLLVAGGAAAAWRALLFTAPVAKWYDKMKFSVPLLGPLYSKIAVVRFARIVSMLVRNGVAFMRVLEVASDVVANTHFRELVYKAKEEIGGGGSIADGFSGITVFPPMVAGLVAVGERSGSLDEMLDYVVDAYDMEVRYSLKNLVGMIEPLITVVIGIGVLFLALAVYLPIWNMSQVIGV